MWEVKCQARSVAKRNFQSDILFHSAALKAGSSEPSGIAGAGAFMSNDVKSLVTEVVIQGQLLFIFKDVEKVSSDPDEGRSSDHPTQWKF